ncbi:hypothetical protein WK15_11700 [Burkholderia ubonensis]|uniref:hypothetical protein n=1 Tax=Burkholderia ubonensis TaxID=101571 RepID=UPI0007572FCD|nr:hypothetical protein [Burkholderia ubonensis]KVR27821.1 hypothetical protein WK15_11700 [Burkholderia ubonensis]KWB93982.1 hypothetical protein WL45_15715 [Burkholderia ubonensis]KWC17439.1 hypothetical protein WL46_26610 [Burkholderia ubonensis]
MPASADREFVSRWPATAGAHLTVGKQKAHIARRGPVWECWRHDGPIVMFGFGTTALHAWHDAHRHSIAGRSRA